MGAAGFLVDFNGTFAVVFAVYPFDVFLGVTCSGAAGLAFAGEVGGVMFLGLWRPLGSFCLGAAGLVFAGEAGVLVILWLVQFFPVAIDQNPSSGL